MITLNPTDVGRLDRDHQAVLEDRKKMEARANGVPTLNREKKKARGRTKAMNRYLRKQANIIDTKKVKIKEELEKRQKDRQAAERKRRGEPADHAIGGGGGGVVASTALKRFQKK